MQLKLNFMNKQHDFAYTLCRSCIVAILYYMSQYSVVRITRKYKFNSLTELAQRNKNVLIKVYL